MWPESEAQTYVYSLDGARRERAVVLCALRFVEDIAVHRRFRPIFDVDAGEVV